MEAATLETTETGKVATTEGWFVVNAAEAEWFAHDHFGSASLFEGKTRLPQLGINLRVLQPGQPNCMYHREGDQEDFLVLRGECLLLIEEREVRLKARDFVHCPAGARHVFVGAGDGPCILLMVGARSGSGVSYPVSELARRHGAGVEEETDQPAVAHAPYGPPRKVTGAAFAEVLRGL